MSTTGLLTMSRKELDRTEWMLRVHERRMTQAQVAEHLGLSLRQVERLYRAYKAHGASGLISKKRGRPSERQLSVALRNDAVTLVRDKYGDFGPWADPRVREARRGTRACGVGRDGAKVDDRSGHLAAAQSPVAPGAPASRTSSLSRRARAARRLGS